MTRWSLLAIAFAIVACSEGDRDQAARDASEAAADADSALEADPGTADAAEKETEAPREPDTEADRPADQASRRAGADTGEVRQPTRSDAAAGRGPTGAEAMGGVRAAPGAAPPAATPTATARLDLSRDEVRQLQTALNQAGCDAGEPDGMVGRQTRQAIACGLRKNGLRSNDFEGLYRALDLDFD